MKIIYKLCQLEPDGKYYSFNLVGEHGIPARIEYKIGEVAEPTVKGSQLFAFNNMSDLSNFAFKYQVNRMSALVCECEDFVKPDKHYLRLLKSGVTHEQLKKLWDDNVHLLDYLEYNYIDLPIGTVLTPKLRPISKIVDFYPQKLLV